MSDSFQCIAFPAVPPSEAEEVASRLLESLVSRDIVEPEPNPDCALDEEGHLPGKEFASALSDPGAGGHLKGLETNGVIVVEESTVFSGSEPPETTTCPKCNHSFDGGEDFIELIGEWFEGEEPTLECASCGEASPLEQVETSPAWALAHAGLKFWNWPELSEEFVASLVAVVGSKAILVTGKL